MSNRQKLMFIMFIILLSVIYDISVVDTINTAVTSATSANITAVVFVHNEFETPNTTNADATQCLHDFRTRCTLEYSHNLLFRTPTNIKTIPIDIQNLTYFVVGHHGGVQNDIISYLYTKLHISNKRIYSHCVGPYCYHVDDYRFFNVVASKVISSIIRHSNRKHNTKFYRCCSQMSNSKLSNITYIHTFAHDFRDGINKKFPQFHNKTKQIFDVIICSFPGVQCLGYLRFAKVIILRFAHRYDHHVWDYNAARIKWTQILNIIASNCIHSNILLFVTNIYDWFYLKHAVRINDDQLYLWPNFAQHFVSNFSMESMRHSATTKAVHNETMMYVHIDNKHGQKCQLLLNGNKLQYELQEAHNIHLATNQSKYKKYLYNVHILHNRIKGIIAVPYSVHAAKWAEFYSVGIAIFLPSLRFWKELNTKCDAVNDRQAGNSGERQQDNWRPTNRYSPCCDTDPYDNKDQDVWLPFSDYYNDKLFQFIMYYDNETHLKQYIVQHNQYSVKYRNEIKRKQIDAWKKWSEVFAINIADVLSAAYQASLKKESNCIPTVVNLAEDVIQMPSNKSYMKRVYDDSIGIAS